MKTFADWLTIPICAIVCCLIFVSFQIFVSVQETEVPSYVQLEENIYIGNGYYEKTSEEINPDETGSYYIFEDESGIETARMIIAELQVPDPEQLPSGFTFKTLTVGTFMSGRWEYEYLYENQDSGQTLRIGTENAGNGEVEKY